MASTEVKLKFRVLYRSRFRNQQPAVVGSISELGDWNIVHGLHQRARCLPVNEGSLDGEFSGKIWESAINVPTDITFQWKWVVLNCDGDIVKQENKPRKLKVEKQNLLIHCAWQVEKEVIIPNVCTVQVLTHYVAPPGFCIGIIGNMQSLGAWDPQRCMLMSSCYPRGSGKWRASFIAGNESEVDWKLALINKETREVLRWEERGNRSMVLCSEVVKMEVRWGEGAEVRDTISQDYDALYNTAKILREAGLDEDSNNYATAVGTSQPETVAETEGESSRCSVPPTPPKPSPDQKDSVPPTKMKPSRDEKDEASDTKKGKVFKVIVKKPSIVKKKLMSSNTPPRKRSKTPERSRRKAHPVVGIEDTFIIDAWAEEQEIQEVEACPVTSLLPEIEDLSQKVKLMGYPETIPEKDVYSYYETPDVIELMGCQRRFSFVMGVILMFKILYEFYLQVM